MLETVRVGTVAASSLLALIDDIATILDDVAVLTKVATKKTAGVLGDDLALNAQQVSGVHADRELPVVWAVAKGSFVNKAILVPLALAISALAPWLVTPLLMVGGAYLCYEGFEKVVHKVFDGPDEKAHHAEHLRAVTDENLDLVAYEKNKVKGAIRTDFVLSAEIIVIALGTVAAQPFVTRVVVLALIAIVMTAGVYGLVAGIVKLDDLGLYLVRRGGSDAARSLGRAILALAPWLMKTLSVAGTAAMFLVGGSIIEHGVPDLHHVVEGMLDSLSGSTRTVAGMLGNAVVGIIVGAAMLGLTTVAKRLSRRMSGDRSSELH